MAICIEESSIPEVYDFNLSKRVISEHDILKLDVPVRDVHPMHIVECAAHARDDSLEDVFVAKDTPLFLLEETK